ncbi:hypothetical protein P8452_00926 [Trifolium repens]|nr:hypothetical protein P8452_00926 [Trifolium repens]
MAKSCFANVIEIIDSDDEPDVSHNVGAFTTTIGAKSSSVNVIDIIDSDEERDVSQNVPLDRQDSGNISVATSFAEEKENNLDILFTSNSKRKRACNVVMSESESDRDDDNMRNSLTTANLEADKVTDGIRMPRRRLKTLRKIRSKKSRGDDELEEDLSYSEESSMGDFIVDVTDCEDFSNKSQDESGSLQDLQDNNKDSHLQDVSDRKGSGNISLSTCSAAEKGKNLDSNYDQINDGNSDLGEDLLCFVTSKGKQIRNVVMSESENDDDDDDLPTSKLIGNHVKEISVDELANVVGDGGDGGDDDDDAEVIRMKKARRRRLKPLKECVSKSGDDKTPSYIPTNDDAHDNDESEEDLSETEEGNLNGFIVDDSNCEDTSSESEDGGCNGDMDSDDSNNSQDLQHRRSKDSNLQDVSDEKIDYEFQKDPVLCMKAVCVLNREQIAKERMYKYTQPFCYSGRGFNKFDAARGSTLARFITDGDPEGDIKKTVKELKQFNSKGVKICKSFAKRYWRQLYAIFKNKADRFFP